MERTGADRGGKWLHESGVAFLAFVILFCLFELSTGLAQSQDSSGQAIPADVYWQQIEKALIVVRWLEGADIEAVQKALGALAAEFNTFGEIELADGREIPLDNGYLVTLLLDPGPDLVRLEAYLTAVQASRNGWPDPIHDSQDLMPLGEVLARPEFQLAPQEPGLIQRIWQRIDNFLLDILALIFPQSAGGLGPLFQIALTIVGSIVLIAVLLFAMQGILTNFVADEESMVLEGGDPTLVNADQALEKAHALSKSGDYRSAVRFLYISSLLMLEERGHLYYDRTQTNQEYLRNVVSRPELATVLGEVIDVFDRVWYGFQPLDEQAFIHYAGRVERLRRQQ